MNEKRKQVSFVSFLLVLVNVLVCVYGRKVDGAIYRRGMLDAIPVLEEGEYFRLITATFLHMDLDHLFNNMVILFFLGDMLEKITGHVSILVVYLFSGVCGSVASLYYKLSTGYLVPSLGASGAIFGLDGWLLAMVLFSGHRVKEVSLQRTVAMVLLSVYSGYAGKNIDNAGHLGGLFGGFILGFVCFVVIPYIRDFIGRGANNEY